MPISKRLDWVAKMYLIIVGASSGFLFTDNCLSFNNYIFVLPNIEYIRQKVLVVSTYLYIYICFLRIAAIHLLSFHCVAVIFFYFQHIEHINIPLGAETVWMNMIMSSTWMKDCEAFVKNVYKNIQRDEMAVYICGKFLPSCI